MNSEIARVGCMSEIATLENGGSYLVIPLEGRPIRRLEATAPTVQALSHAPARNLSDDFPGRPL